MAYVVHTLAHFEHLLTTMWTRHARAGLAVVVIVAAGASAARAQSSHPLTIRGHEQILHLSGPSNGEPVIVSSGDGGWIHLGPHVAEMLAARGFFVVGFDAKAYLASFTTDQSALRPSEEPADYQASSNSRRQQQAGSRFSIGVSEGAGLSVLAATDPDTQGASSRGVVGLGLPDLNELGWRWKDSLIYLTHRRAERADVQRRRHRRRRRAAAAGGHPLDARRVRAAGRHRSASSRTRAEPKRLWIVEARRITGSATTCAEFDARLLEAIEWVRATSRGEAIMRSNALRRVAPALDRPRAVRRRARRPARASCGTSPGTS